MFLDVCGLCAQNNCYGDGSCLLIEEQGQFTCEVDPGHFTSQIICENDHGHWCSSCVGKHIKFYMWTLLFIKGHFITTALRIKI